LHEVGPAPMAFGDRIRQLRKEAGWSQAGLGDKIGTDRLANLIELSGDDLASLLHMPGALVAKNRLKTLAGGIS
jgi:transcriptional regulator with XRE-family HTH domain